MGRNGSSRQVEAVLSCLFFVSSGKIGCRLEQQGTSFELDHGVLGTPLSVRLPGELARLWQWLSCVWDHNGSGSSSPGTDCTARSILSTGGQGAHGGELVETMTLFNLADSCWTPYRRCSAGGEAYGSVACIIQGLCSTSAKAPTARIRETWIVEE